MTVAEAVAALGVFAASALGGALNSVAGGGSFIVFPALLLWGLGPVDATATTTVALWPAGLGSAAAYRRELPRDRRVFAVLGLSSVVGGLLGAKLLLVTSDATFTKILPLLMLAASGVFTWGARSPRGAKAEGTGTNVTMGLGLAAFLQVFIATYGGYFGGGIGILMLATFTLMGMHEMHSMNAMKVVLATVINGVAVVAFVAVGKVAWAAAVPGAIGAVVGGFLGAALARRVDPKRIRRLVLVFAWSLTVWFAVRAFV